MTTYDLFYNKTNISSTWSNTYQSLQNMNRPVPARYKYLVMQQHAVLDVLEIGSSTQVKRSWEGEVNNELIHRNLAHRLMTGNCRAQTLLKTG